MRGLSRILAVAVLGFLCSACSVTRKIPEGQYLLQKVTIESDKSTPRKERITAADLEKYVRQTPNKRFLGTNFYVWLYEQANPGKQNWWNNWKRKIGQEPVLLDMSLTERSAQNLKVYMDTRGFFSSQATFEVDTTSRRRRAKVVYRTRQGEPYRIDSISYDFQDKFLEQIILPDTANTLIRPGRVFDIAVLDRERERVTAFLKERGYYNFTVNNIDYAIRYASDAICWTQAPERLRDLCKQRKRWHLGLFQSMYKHRVMFSNHRFGAVSFVSYLYFLIYELLSPFIEIFGVFTMVLAWWFDLINVPFMLLFFLIYAVFGGVLTLTAFFSRIYTADLTLSFGDGLKAVCLCLFELVFLRFILAWVRCTAFIGYKKKKLSWGRIERRKIDLK